MADPEHLRLLSHGAVTWNAWRVQNPNVYPDLSEANLQNANLNWFDLRQANLQRADLSGAGFLGSSWLNWSLLDQADLSGANLSLANLNGATLRGAILKGVVLRRAILSWCDLRHATLENADLAEATIVGADFSGAAMSGTSFSGSLVHGALGLEEVKNLPCVPFPFYTRVVHGPLVPKSLQSSDIPTAEQQMAILRQGVVGWNDWRTKNDLLSPNLRGMDLRGVNLEQANLSDADLSGANLSGVCLSRADLSRAFLKLADLENADLSDIQASEATFTSARLRGSNMTRAAIGKAVFDSADLRDVRADGIYGEHPDFLNANLERFHASSGMLRGGKFRAANLSGSRLGPQTNLMETDFADALAVGADLSESNFDRADFTRTCLLRANLSKAYLFRAEMASANLSFANLQGADLIRTDLIGTNLEHADISDARIYGAAAWDLKTNDKTVQSNLIITWPGEPIIRVDSIELAQFVYLLLRHEKLRDAINSVAERGVLLLGRFGGGGLEVLRAVAAELRKQKYLPMIFDFERPTDRNYTETVKTLVGLSRFVIVDLSGPSVPQELYATVPHFKIPFVPIIEKERKIYAMFADLLENPWVLDLVKFENTDDLLAKLPADIIAPAEAASEKRRRRLSEIFGEPG